MSKNIKNYKAIKGFTLIEVLISAALIGIFGLSILSLQFITNQTQVSVFRNYLSVDEANNNIATLARELRNTRTADNGAYALERAWDQEISFYSDIDYDGEVEKVRYYLDDVDLIKSTIEPQGYPATYPSETAKIKTVASNVRNLSTPIFYYYNGDWPSDVDNNPLDTPTRLSDTKLMKVRLDINPEEDSPERNFSIETYVQIRTLKENL